jgi:hypothetical protein
VNRDRPAAILPRVRLLALLLVLSACGRVDFERVRRADAAVEDAGRMDAAVRDGGLDAGSARDAGSDAGMFDAGPPPSCRWGEPARLTGLASSDDERDPTLTRDLLRICFTSTRGTGNDPDIFCATRASTALDFALPIEVAAINSGRSEIAPSLVPDGSALFYATNSTVEGGDDIFFSTITAGVFGEPALARDVNTNRSEGGPSITGDGLTMYLHQHDGVARQILHATRPSREMEWGDVEIVPGVSTSAGDERDPSISEDGRSLVFCSNESGTNAIYCASGEGTSFGAPIPAEIATVEGAACSPFVASDGALYFAWQGDLWRAPPL